MRAMRVVRNIGYVKRRKRTAKWSSLFGVALLGSTFWLALNPSLVILAYIPLLVGTLIFHHGMQQVAKWNRNPRNDMVLDKQLQHLDDRYTLIHYATLGRRAIDHLLVHPGGVLVLTARELAGNVRHRNGRWRKGGAGLGRIFGLGGPQLGNPTWETQQHVASVDRYLSDAQFETEVDGVIVFLNPLVTLDVEEPDYPVTNADGLPEYLRSIDRTDELASAERERLIELLSQGEELEVPQRSQRRRPVKRRAA
jgi:hypothetical protein